MNVFKLIMAAALVFCGALAYAQGENPIIRKKGERVPLRDVTSIEKVEGNQVHYKSKGSTIRLPLKDIEYIYMPKKMIPDMGKADKLFDQKKYAEAFKIYTSLFGTWSKAGWNAYLGLRIAECAEAMEDPKAALPYLKELEGVELHKDYEKWKVNDFERALGMLAFINAQAHNTADAERVTKIIFEKSYTGAFPAAYNAQGLILYDQSKPKDAFFKFAATALLHDKTPESAVAMRWCANILKELKDARSARYAQMLKETHPGSPEIAKLK